MNMTVCNYNNTHPNSSLFLVTKDYIQAEVNFYSRQVLKIKSPRRFCSINTIKVFCIVNTVMRHTHAHATQHAGECHLSNPDGEHRHFY